jgi:hypothetical protein
MSTGRSLQQDKAKEKKKSQIERRKEDAARSLTIINPRASQHQPSFPHK